MKTSENSWALLHSQSREDSLRDQLADDPSSFFAMMAARELHWFDENSSMWLNQRDNGEWSGFCDSTGDYATPVTESYVPWTDTLDDSQSPCFRWYVGGMTNACFNEIDRHLLAGRGQNTAFIFEGDRWDPSKNDGRGGPVVEHKITYRKLLFETVLRADTLRSLGLKMGDRVVFNMPNILENIYYTLAAKRLGIIYTPVFGGFSAKTLSDRIHDAGAKVIVTTDSGYRNAEIIPFKNAYTDPALDDYIPLQAALSVLREIISEFDISETGESLFLKVATSLEGEITIERSDLTLALGAALSEESLLDAEVTARLRTHVAKRLAKISHSIEKVIVVRYTGQKTADYARDVSSHQLVDQSRKRMRKFLDIKTLDALNSLSEKDFWVAMNSFCRAKPVEANWPLFFIYTSGSTGKPKGLVHSHGGWLAGITHTMRVIFNATKSDRCYVIADPGWITGQSYLIAAPLSFGLTSIIAEGSPLYPQAGRFASIIERHKVTIFKAGATFLKAVMTDPASQGDVEMYDTSTLRVSTFCAEPVSPAVQKYGMESICQNYINSYWATEHGGMVFSCPWGGYKTLLADAKTWPLPWIQAEVRIATASDESGQVIEWRVAEEGEKGELVITNPYPYLARTIWGNTDQLFEVNWCGDRGRFTEAYFTRWRGRYSYTQGDYARIGVDGSFTLHGRSDDVINVSGHRIGTEEIEGAILKDKTIHRDSPVGNVVVVGAPHQEKGEIPVAFILGVNGRKLNDDDIGRLKSLVRSEKGVTAVPSDFLTVSAFPETRSGKYMRRALRSILIDEDLGDLSTLRNPHIIREIQETINIWKALRDVTESAHIAKSWRYIRFETHLIPPDFGVGLIFIENAPVNALSERTLDEFNSALQQIALRDDLKALVVTGTGKTFAGGADIKELLEIGKNGNIDSARALPNSAHAAFTALENLGMPVIAAVNGHALGGGSELVLACNYVIALKSSKFGQPEINLNLLPGYGGTQRLTRKLFDRQGSKGITYALRMMIGGRSITADEAMAVGLVQEIVDLTKEGILEAAIRVLRAHFGGSSILESQLTRHSEYLSTLERSINYDQSLFADERLVSTIAQARASGRSETVDLILESVAYGSKHGIARGLVREADLFAKAMISEELGVAGIEAFLEKRSAPLPLKHPAISPFADEAMRRELEKTGRLLPLGSSFYPGVTTIPEYQFGLGITRSELDGKPIHGDPADVEKLLIMETPRPGPNEALVYVLASEMNFNDIWAITGIPVSPFDSRDTDIQVTGSGGVALVVQLGSELVEEGRISIGDLVTIYSGQSDILSPIYGADPMAANFRIQGYERNDGSHAQFLTVQGPQLHKKLSGLTIEQAGCYGLKLGTVHRALYTTLDIRAGKCLFVEGAATGTGLDCMRTAIASGLSVVGMVSSHARSIRVDSEGGRSINRKDPRWSHIFTPVPIDPDLWSEWEEAGVEFVNETHRLADGQINYVLSHAGESVFSRSFQLLGQHGILTFFGATSGYHFSFMGKGGTCTPKHMLDKAGLRGGENLLVVYGPGADDGVIDALAIEAIEIGCKLGCVVAVLCDTNSQRDFVVSMGFGVLMQGVVSIEELERRLGDDFDPPRPLAIFPDPFKDQPSFKAAIRRFSDRTVKPIGSAIRAILSSAHDGVGQPDVVFERSHRDTLALSCALVKPNIGKVVYSEDLAHKRFSFYAPQVWTRQRCILMPTAEIRGTHLNTAQEFIEMQKKVATGQIQILPPKTISMEDAPEAHQLMWENRHEGTNYVVGHAIPCEGLKSRQDLLSAWAARDAKEIGITHKIMDTGSGNILK